jgi:hypothetical protein
MSFLVYAEEGPLHRGCLTVVNMENLNSRNCPLCGPYMAVLGMQVPHSTPTSHPSLIPRTAPFSIDPYPTL